MSWIIQLKPSLPTEAIKSAHSYDHHISSLKTIVELNLFNLIISLHQLESNLALNFGFPLNAIIGKNVLPCVLESRRNLSPHNEFLVNRNLILIPNMMMVKLTGQVGP
uniref:Uncharacterized protein n=1 Tax=Opuntia streptacantha TaxID=393608 RepID=A0A7C9CZM9_OPUST